MTSNAAPTLTEGQIKKSLISRKKKPVQGKTVLFAPYVAKWPQVEAVIQQDMIGRLKRFFQDNSIVKTASGPGGNKRPKKSDNVVFTSEQLKLRNRVSCGVQKVTRCLERDLLSLVVVDRSSPWQLHQHLAQLAAVRRCPAVAVDNLATSLGALLGVTRLCAVGFLKPFEPDTCLELTQIVTSLADLCPSIDLPWLECSEHLQNLQQTLITEVAATSATSPPDDSVSVTRTDVERPEITVPAKLDDYSHLYIFKKPKTEVTLSRDFGQFVALPASSSSSEDDDDDDWNFNDVKKTKGSDKKMEVGSISKTNCGGAKRKKLDGGKPERESVYKSADTGSQIANPNKKRKTTK